MLCRFCLTNHSEPDEIGAIVIALYSDGVTTMLLRQKEHYVEDYWYQENEKATVWTCRTREEAITRFQDRLSEVMAEKVREQEKNASHATRSNRGLFGLGAHSLASRVAI